MTEAPAPSISFAIPTYQHGHALPRALDSIFAQPGGDTVEVVVSNNASTDDTAEVLARYTAAHPNLRVVTQPQAVSFNENVARVIEACTGDYVWTLSSDDALLDGALAHVMTSLSGQREPVVVLANWWIADSSLQPIRLRRPVVPDRTVRGADEAVAELGVWAIFMSALVLPAPSARAHLAHYREQEGLIHWRVATLLAATGMPVLSIGAPLVYQRWADAGAMYDYDPQRIFGREIREHMQSLRASAALPRRVARTVEGDVLRVITRGFVGTARRVRPDIARRWFRPLLREYWSYRDFWIWVSPLYLIPRPVLDRLWPLVRGIRDRIVLRARGR